MSVGDRETEIAAVVIWRDGKILIGQRPAGVSLAGYWEFPGGKLAVGETPQQAAVRECLEETGLAVKLDASYPSSSFDYPFGRLRLHFFSGHILASGSVMPDRFKWVLPAELRLYTFPPANSALIAHLLHED